MKKLVLIIGIILFTGCGSKRVITCSYFSKESDREMNLSVRFTHKGNKVLRVDSIETVKSSDSNILSYYKNDAETFYAPFEDLDHYDYDIVMDEDKISITTSINYNKIDLNEMIMIDPSIEQLVDDGYIDFNQMKEYYEKLDYICKK